MILYVMATKPLTSKFRSTKTYGNDRGMSCTFRQWKATHSHCSLLHGYSIGIKLIFESDTLDDRNWVMDFGGLGEFKRWAEGMFDHTVLVSEDDPQLAVFELLNSVPGGWCNKGICDLRIVPGVGCEMFAKMCFDKMESILESPSHMRPVGESPVRLVSVEVFEHSANSAIYAKDAPAKGF